MPSISGTPASPPAPVSGPMSATCSKPSTPSGQPSLPRHSPPWPHMAPIRTWCNGCYREGLRPQPPLARPLRPHRSAPRPLLPHRRHPPLVVLSQAGHGRPFAYYIVNRLPPGVRGILVAGLFATAMGSLSTALNALATSFTEDWYMPYINPGGNAGSRRPRCPHQHGLLFDPPGPYRRLHRLRQTASSISALSRSCSASSATRTVRCSGCFSRACSRNPAATIPATSSR